MNHLLQHYIQLNTSHYWMLVNMCPYPLCWGLQEVQLQCCHSLLQVFSSSGVSSLCSLSLCGCIACNFACAVLCHESCPTLDSFILVMYQVLLYKMQTSVAWRHLWQPGVTSCLPGFDWQVTCQPDSGHGVCVHVFVDLSEGSVETLRTANMNFP